MSGEREMRDRRRESSTIKNSSNGISRTAKFEFQSNGPSSVDSNNKSGREKVIIDKDDDSPFQSYKKLKQKANEKKLEKDISNYEKQSNKSIGCIKQIMDEEVDKSDKMSKFSRKSLISNQNL
jgi:hypothetical protein